MKSHRYSFRSHDQYGTVRISAREQRASGCRSTRPRARAGTSGGVRAGNTVHAGSGGEIGSRSSCLEVSTRANPAVYLLIRDGPSGRSPIAVYRRPGGF